MTTNLTQQQTNCPSKHIISNTQLMGLIYSSGIASKLNLSNPAIIVLNSFAYHWNTIRNDCFPTQYLIASKTGLSVSSIKRGIKELLTKNLIIKTKKGNSSTNLYKFTGKFFELLNLNSGTAQVEPHLEVNLTPACYEHKKTNIRKEQTSLFINKEKNKNDDVSKTQSITEYRECLNKLESWGVLGAKKIIHQHSIEKIKKIILLVENKKPENYGAYFRTLINMPNVIHPVNNNSCAQVSEIPLINQMVKHQYWKHIPTGKILKVLPDVGTHLLIKYWKDENMVTFVEEEDFTDKLENFNVVVF